MSDRFQEERGCRQRGHTEIFLFCRGILSILMKIQNDIKAINIDDDDSIKALESTPYALYYVAFVSGFKTNFIEIKAVWIGSNVFSNKTFYYRK